MTRNIVETTRAMRWDEGATSSRPSAILGIAFGMMLALIANLMLR